MYIIIRTFRPNWIASPTSRDYSLKIKVLALSASDSGSSPDCRIITSQVET